MEKTRILISGVFLVDQATKEETRVLGQMVFGRVDTDKNFPVDTLISRRHLRIVPTGDAVLIEDLGSTNRTRVNGKLLRASTIYRLRSRDLIEFGQQKFQIFIDGKIVGGATGLISREKENEEAVEQSLIFERIAVDEKTGEAALAAQPDIIRGLEGLDIQSEADRGLATRRDDALVGSLVTRKNSAWYLQFGGSEFGPLSIKELKVVVKSKQFQGGLLFAFTEGLTDWLPVDRLMPFLDESRPELTATQRLIGGVALAGIVSCVVRGAGKEGQQGKLESVNLSELTASFRQPLVMDSPLFEVEVAPDPASGIEPFRATAKVDGARSNGQATVLVLVQATPRTKMSIERFLRSKG